MADTRGRGDPPCYNCGQLGHMFNACPEPTRNPPAGLEASRAREKNRNNSPGREGSFSNRHGNAPVITRYSHPGSYSVNSTPSYPTPPPGYHPFPPPPHGYDGYGGQSKMTDHVSHGYYGGPSQGGYPPQQSPYGSAPPSQPYNQPYTHTYGGHHASQGSIPPHSTSYSHGPPHPYQHVPPPPSYPYPPPSHPHPEISHGYNQQQYRANPSDYHHKPLELYESHPPPPSLPLPPPPPPPGTFDPFSHETHYGTQHQFEPGYRDRRPGPAEHRSQTSRNDRSQKQARHESHRQPRDRLNHGAKRSNSQHQQRRRDKSKAHWRHDDQPPPKSRPKQSPEPKTDHRDLNISSESPMPQPTSSGPGEALHESNIGSPVPTPVSDSGSDCDQESTWDERTVFLEIKTSKEADPIAQPLPAEYNSDDLMMPPAYGSTGLISKYVTPDNIDDFSQSVRETKQWRYIKDRIEFADPKTIQVAKLGIYVKAAHASDDKSRNSHVGNSHGSDKRKPKDRDKQRAPDKRKRAHDNHNINGWHHSDSRDREINQDRKRPKLTDIFERGSSSVHLPKGVSSPESGELLEADASTSTPWKGASSPKAINGHSHGGSERGSTGKDARLRKQEEKKSDGTRILPTGSEVRTTVSKTTSQIGSGPSEQPPPVQSQMVQNEPRKTHPLPPRPPGPIPSFNHKGSIAQQPARNPEPQKKDRRNSITTRKPEPGTKDRRNSVTARDPEPEKRGRHNSVAASQPISVKSRDDESLDSELDNIELELLGMAPSNDSESETEKPNPRKQQDTGRNLVDKGRIKKRRRQNTNSVYGRRW